MKTFSDPELAARQMASRLKSERHAMKLSADACAKAGGVSRTTQFTYENATSVPDANYLAGLAVLGMDVLYVLTGRRERSTPSISKRERQLLDAYARASPEVRVTIEGVVEMAAVLAELTVSPRTP